MAVIVRNQQFLPHDTHRLCADLYIPHFVVELQESSSGMHRPGKRARKGHKIMTAVTPERLERPAF